MKFMLSKDLVLKNILDEVIIHVEQRFGFNNI